LLQRGCYAEQAAIEEQPQRRTVQAVGAYGRRLRQHRHTASEPIVIDAA